jgi:hypothetical protein
VGSGTSALGCAVLCGIVVEPVFAAFRAGLLLLQLSPLFLFFALFATVAHGTSLF